MDQNINSFSDNDNDLELLQEKLNEYKNQQDTLKTDIKVLIEENEKLSSYISENLQNKITDAENSNELLNNLQDQLSSALKEKALSYDLWQNALKTIEQLEDELKCFIRNDSDYFNKNSYEKLQLNFEKKLQQSTHKYKDIIKSLEDKNKLSENNLTISQTRLSRLLDEHKIVLHKIKNKETEITSLKKNSIELQNELDEYLLQEKKLHNKEEETKIIVSEAVIVAETALKEKEEAIFRESQAKEESLKLTKTISEIITEAGDKVKNEVELVKSQYNEKIKTILKDMKMLQSDLNAKNLELENMIKIHDELKTELARVKSTHLHSDDDTFTQLLITEKKLESVRNKLLFSERQNIKISAERDMIKFECDRLLNEFQLNKKEYDVQKNKLQGEIINLESSLMASNNKIIDYSENIKDLNSQITNLHDEMTRLSKKQEKKTENKSSQLNFNKKRTAVTQHELHIQLESVHKLKNRWKTEMKDVIIKLQKRIKELKNENGQLREIIKNNSVDTIR